MNDLKEKLIEKIKAGEVKMKPHWRVVLKLVLYAVSVVIVALIAVYLLSFIFFAMYRTGVIFAPLFGWRGLMLFIASSPWPMMFLLAVFLLLLYVLVSHYSFSYRKPLVYSMVGVVFFVIVVSSLIHKTGIHDRIQRFFELHEIMGFSPLYRHAMEGRPDTVFVGSITDMNGERIMIHTDANEDVFFTFPAQMEGQREEFHMGDLLLIFGDRDEDDIQVFGVRSIDEGTIFPPPHQVQYH